MFKTLSCIIVVTALAVLPSASAQARGGASRTTVAPGATASDVNAGGMSQGGIGPGRTLIAPGAAPTGMSIDQVQSGVPLAPGPAGQLSGEQMLTTPRLPPPTR